MTPPQHICPKCHKAQGADAFVNEKGKPTKWCLYCRAGYRERLTNLHQRDATKPKREEAINVDEVATREGYANHPLATLLALSHIAGAKRALAIRDGNSWRGKKAWRAYYEAKRALDDAKCHWRVCYSQGDGAACNFGGSDILSENAAKVTCSRCLAFLSRRDTKRDPNSSGVS